MSTSDQLQSTRDRSRITAANPANGIEARGVTVEIPYTVLAGGGLFTFLVLFLLLR